MRWGWSFGPVLGFMLVRAAGTARAAAPPIPPAFLHVPAAPAPAAHASSQLGVSHPATAPAAHSQAPLPLPPPPPGATAQASPPPAATPPAAKPVAAAVPEKPEPAPMPKLVFKPYWETLNSSDVYLRQGPGFQYPIRWVYHRRGMPVKVLRKFDVWRLVVDPAGDRGWIHEILLSGVRGFMVTAKSVLLRARPSGTARAVAMVEHGVVGKLRACPPGPWCRVIAGGHDGWVPRSAIFGVDPNEVVK